MYWIGPLAGGALGGLLHVLWYADGDLHMTFGELFGVAEKGSLTGRAREGDALDPMPSVAV